MCLLQRLESISDLTHAGAPRRVLVFGGWHRHTLGCRSPKPRCRQRPSLFVTLSHPAPRPVPLELLPDYALSPCPSVCAPAGHPPLSPGPEYHSQWLFAFDPKIHSWRNSRLHLLTLRIRACLLPPRSPPVPSRDVWNKIQTTLLARMTRRALPAPATRPPGLPWFSSRTRTLAPLLSQPGALAPHFCTQAALLPLRSRLKSTSSEGRRLLQAPGPQGPPPGAQPRLALLRAPSPRVTDANSCVTRSPSCFP